ncbi:uncharacterized protein LOC143038755 isoform X2 [Oratosquilla oratoria]
MSVAISGLEKPKRKRGRPRKSEQVKCVKEEPKEEFTLSSIDLAPRRSNRKVSIPSRFKDTVAGRDFEKLLQESGVEVKNENEFYEDIDEEYKQTLNNCSSDGTSIIVAPDTSDVATEMPLSVNIEVDFQEDGNVSLKGMEGLMDSKPQAGSPVVSVSSVQIAGADERVNMPSMTSFSEPTLFRKKRGPRKKAKWVCEICGKGFLHKGRYANHMRLHKTVIYQCEACKDKFSNREDLAIHQEETQHSGLGIIEIEKDEKNNIEFKCPHCPSRSFVSQEGYNKHVASMHEGQKPHACEVCGKRFVYQHSLRNHYTLHEPPKTEREYPCPSCGKVFTHPSSLIYHRESSHNNGRKFVCSICGAAFKHKQLLQRHHHVHSDDRPYACNLCSAAFKTRGNLHNHMNTHSSIKKFTCEICGKQFGHLTSLTLHVRSHTGEKPFKCEHCGKRFTQNGNLQEHIRTHTGEKPYCCETCGKKFTTSSQFKLHCKRHTGERPFQCTFCMKSFLNKDAWKSHERKHRGEKPFECEYCHKGFTEHWSLKKHIRLHTGVKPYSCNFCGKTFSDSSNLHKHKRCHRDGEAFILPHSVAALESNNSGGGEQRVIYILSDKEEGATLTALEAVGACMEQRVAFLPETREARVRSPEAEIADVSQLENLPDSAGAQMIQLSSEDGQNFEGLALAYDQTSTTSGVMSQPGNMHGNARQIQIFTSEEGQSFLPVIASVSSESNPSEVDPNFLPSNEANDQGAPATQNHLGGSSTLEITLKDGQPLSLVIPDGEDPTVYVQRAIESAVMAQE